MINFVIKIQFLFKQITDTFASIIRVILFSRPVGAFPFRKSDNCFVLGNGPSLIDGLDFLKKNNGDFDLFCVNMFSNSPSYSQLKPGNYLLLDNAFINPNHELAAKAIQKIASDTNWPLNLFVPNKFKKSNYFKEVIAKKTNIKVFYINYVIFESFDWLRFWVFRKNIAMPQCQNVLVALTFQCINLAYKNVYLLGADHSWHENIRLNERNELNFIDTHFYGEKNINTKKTSEKSYLATQFLSLHKAFKGYEVLVRYAKNRGVNIYNASTKSYIDVFEKIKLTDIGNKK